MSPIRLALALFFPFTGLVACSDDPEPVDAGPSDSGVVDSGVLDSGIHDSGVDLCPTGRAPTVIELDPIAQRVPFPTGQLHTVPAPTVLDPDALRVSLPFSPNDSPSSAAVKVQLNTLDGFSTTGAMFFTASRDLDIATLNGRIAMYPVGADGVADTSARVELDLETTPSSAETPFTIKVRPHYPLAERQNYVVAVLSGINDSEGMPVAASPVFELLKLPGLLIEGDDLATANPTALAALRCQPGITDDQLKVTLSAIETQLAHPRWLEALEQLEAKTPSVPRSEVLLAWNYKTQTIASPLSLVRSTLLPLWESGAAGSRVVGPVVEITGTASIADYAQVPDRLCSGVCLSGGLNGIAPADCLDSNGRVTEAVKGHQVCRLATSLIAGNLGSARLYLLRTFTVTSGNPYTAGTFTPQTFMAPRVVEVPFWVVTGNAAAPASGRPVAIFQHGLGGQADSGFYIANMLSRVGEGWATVLMDAPYHGARRSDLTRLENGAQVPCPNLDPANVTCTPNPLDGTTHCTGGCDGIVDPSGTGFLNVNLGALRDNLRQSVIDQLVLLNAIQQESDAGEPLADLDGARVGFIGHSLGALSGATFASLAPELEAVVLNHGGGDLISILLGSTPQISAPLKIALAAEGVCELVTPGDPTSGCKPTQAYASFQLTSAWLLDPADPLATSIATIAPGGLGVDQILLQMSTPDPVIVNAATLSLAERGYRLPANDEHLQKWDHAVGPQGSGCHAALLAPVCGECLIGALCATFGAQYQAAEFLESGGATIVGQVPPLTVTGSLDCTNPCP